ncbi:MAG: DUF1566 domain-containing protein [Treponema sp.]|nr:DUF1566 domain-containing protein [Treponema sp.]
MKKGTKSIGIIFLAILIGFTFITCDPEGDACTHTAGAAATCSTAQTCTKCSGVIQAALGHQTIDWSTYVPTTGHVSCDRSGCTGGFAKIGDAGQAGGIIFYVDKNGFKLYQGTNNTLASDTYITVYYLEAWTESVPSIRWSWANQPTWSPDEYTDVPLVQQAHDTGNPTQWIGYGLRNTRLIISAMNAMVSPNNEDTLRGDRAVHVASTTKGGKDDWFLPSVDELNVMYIASTEPNSVSGLPTSGWHWSSSQVYVEHAWDQCFDFGYMVSNVGKSYPYDVRAVRAF